MNEKAKELGCEHTNFLNPSGLSEENHYSCAYDLAIMYKYAYDNFEDFRSIVKKTSFSLPVSEKHSNDDRIFQNTNQLILSKSQYYYDKCTGGKSGYTSEAKNCLVSSASSGDLMLICAALGGVKSESNESYRFTDSIALFNYGFENLYKTTIVSAGTVAGKAKVKNAAIGASEVNAIVEKPFYFYLSSENKVADFRSHVEISGDIVAPVEKGQKIGTLYYEIYDKIYKIDLVADKEIPELELPDFGSIVSKILINIFRVIVIIALIVLAIRFYNISIRKKGKSQRSTRMKRYNARFRRKWN